ncbi:MAPK regulated corepressor interacting protein 2-like isoform X1 [Takifugu flavidus]|uniref:MAPK regulated corepressor interacting protein 2-like isoform X1 n=1 Tax=Takifugu flavidus TaxID=433684 RepID=UPI002544AA33|nr:MAPK regulated corepressor interacting protein 2-like isoform X1 [Takifugu flavidus]
MMYTITRGPSKLVTQRRTAPTQQLDTKINDLKHKPSPCTDLPAPRIVFSIRKHPRPAPTRPADRQQIESFTPAHEQNVRFVHDAWQEVVQSREEAQGAVRYEDSSPSPDMDNFVPIDLDEWWAQRFLANIDKLS